MLHDPYQPNLRIGDHVKIVKLGGDRLEGATGTLVGVSAYNVMLYWIIRLDERIYSEELEAPIECVSMPSVCIERNMPDVEEW